VAPDVSLLPADRKNWNLRHRLIWFSWLALLVLLPITSQPHLARLIGGRPVNPPSILPALAILLLGLIPFLLRGGGIPRPIVPLLLFAAVATLATVLSPWIGFHPFQDAQVVDRAARGLITLAVGVTFYLSAVYLPDSDDRLRLSLRVIAIAAVPMLLYATIQPLQFKPIPLRDTLDAVHEFLFSQRPLFRARVTGMAVEPSWFADQLVLFYLPLWLAGVVRRRSAFTSGSRLPWVEGLLLAWGSAMLLLTFSRIGLAAWGTVLVALAAGVGWKAGPWVVDQIKRRRPVQTAGQEVRARPGSRLLGSAFAVFGVVLLAALVLLLTIRFDHRMARLVSLDLKPDSGTPQPVWFTVANELEYAERVIYWTTAGRVFSLHPILGVGLGNSGFYFPQLVPAVGYTLLDVLSAAGASPGPFPNPKSLWFRLVAETGIVGLVLYATWLVVMAACAWELRRRGRNLQGVIGLAAVFALVAFLLEGFSLDTFALPYQWILLGMATAGWARLPQKAPST